MQAEPAHITLSAFDWASILFVVAVVGWGMKYLVQLYARTKGELQKAQLQIESDRAERFLKQQESLEATVHELIKVVSDLKTWVALEFVQQKDYQRDLDRLENDIATHAQRFQQDLDTHRKESHGLRG